MKTEPGKVSGMGQTEKADSSRTQVSELELGIMSHENSTAYNDIMRLYQTLNRVREINATRKAALCVS